jgi:hypothetical protein
MVGEYDKTDPAVKTDLGFTDEVTERDLTPVTLRRPRLTNPCLRLDDGSWWEDD